MVDSSNDDRHPIAKLIADKISKNSSGYAFGVISCAGVVVLAAWGHFGKDVQSSILLFLDPTNRAPLVQQVEAAKERINELTKELDRANARANQAEARSPKADVPLGIVARVIQADTEYVRINLSIQNLSSSEINIAFGPEMPKLTVWGIGATDILGSSSLGICSEEDNCFKSISPGTMRKKSMTLQAGASLPVDFDFFVGSLHADIGGHFDPSVLKKAQASIGIFIRTADARRYHMDVPLTPN